MRTSRQTKAVNKKGNQEQKKHAVTIHLNDRAYKLLVGATISSGFDSPEEMILRDTASLVGQSYGFGFKEEEAYKIFGVKK